MFAAATTLSLTLRLNRQDYEAMPDEWKPPLMIDEVGGAHDPDREVHRPDWRSGGRQGRESAWQPGVAAEHRRDLRLAPQDPLEVVAEGEAFARAQHLRRPGQGVTECEHLDLVHRGPPMDVRMPSIRDREGHVAKETARSSRRRGVTVAVTVVRYRGDTVGARTSPA